MSSMVKVICPSGVLDNAGATQVRAEIDAELETSTKVILLDLQNVDFIDSSGLGVLVMAAKAMRGAGRQMCFCSVKEQPRLLFELTGMEQVFEIFPNRDAFEKAFLVREPADI